MGKKKSSNKIDPAYYAIGAIVLGIAGYYYYINYYLNGIDLSIGGYILDEIVFKRRSISID